MPSLLHLSGLLVREGRPLLSRHGLTDAQFNLLHAAAAVPDGLSQRELSEQLVVDSSNITGLVDRLAARRLVKRAPDPADRRRHRIVLTATGRALHANAAADYERACNILEGSLTKEELSQLLTLLARLESRVAGLSELIAEKSNHTRRATRT